MRASNRLFAEVIKMKRTELPPITKTRLVRDLKKLGVTAGQTLMLHTSVKAIGGLSADQILSFKRCLMFWDLKAR